MFLKCFTDTICCTSYVQYKRCYEWLVFVRSLGALISDASVYQFASRAFLIMWIFCFTCYSSASLKDLLLMFLLLNLVGLDGGVH